MFFRIAPWYEIYQSELNSYIKNSTDFFERMIALIPLEFKENLEKAEKELNKYLEGLNLWQKQLEDKGAYEKEQIEYMVHEEYNRSSIPYDHFQIEEEKQFFFSNVSKSQILLDYAFLDSFLQKVCETASEKTGTRVKLKHFRGSGNTDIKRYYEYLNIVIGLDIKTIESNPDFRKLLELIKIRNAIAHNNEYSDYDGNVNVKIKSAIEIYKDYIEPKDDLAPFSFNIKQGLRTEFSKLIKEILTETLTLLGIQFKENEVIDMTIR